MSRQVSVGLAGGLALLVLSGCVSTVESGGLWGERATITPGWGRVETAFVRAVTDPMTWAPAVAAGIFAASSWDENLSSWASDHSPVFGSVQTADDVGGILLGASIASYAVTAVLAPSGDEDQLLNKAKGAAVGVSALGLTQLTTDFLKAQTNRSRPSGRGSRSFPSGHASMSMAAVSLAGRNLDWIPMEPGIRSLSRAGLYGLAGLTAWSRIEANDHYPSDVLAGMALGRFISIFVNDAFLGPAVLEVVPSGDGKGAVVALRIPF